MAASFPHFMYGSDIIQQYVTGLKPNMSAHESYVHVEPVRFITDSFHREILDNILVFNVNMF